MDTYEAIMSRRTSHLWRPEPVPEEVISKALEGAHRAPCHRFTWPWRFVRVSEVHREALFELALELKSKGREKTPAFMEKIRKKVRNPAELVVVVQPRKEDAFEANGPQLLLYQVPALRRFSGPPAPPVEELRKQCSCSYRCVTA